MAKVLPWSIPGSDGEPIVGDTHIPAGDALGVIVIAHGFKGYKDYGMVPRLAERFADAGFVAHRFNFSHSGMTRRVETFERPDLFERDTFSRQVFDLRKVIAAAHAGDVPVSLAGRPLVLFGHSRGGVTALLAAVRHADDDSLPQPAGIITAAAPAQCNSLSGEEAQRLLRDDHLESPSSRTGQMLRIGRDWLREQIDDPAGHDLAALASRIRCPLLIVHGEDDPTVPATAAHEIAAHVRAGARVLIVPGADHVFNAPNPLPADAPASPQLEALISAATTFARECAAAVAARR
jgi:uncharacterized protein